MFSSAMARGGKVVCLVTLAILVVGLPAPVQALVVTTAADTGPGSLRQALLDANGAGGLQQVTFGALFNAPQTIALNAGFAPLNTPGLDLGVFGPGADRLTIAGAGIDSGFGRLFRVDGPNVSLTLDGLTLTGGDAAFSPPSDEPFGGAIRNNGGTVNITASAIKGNFAEQGGGIYSGGGTLNIANSEISGNQTLAFEGGAGIMSRGAAVTVTDSVITRNMDRTGLGSAGGGIGIEGGTLLVVGSEISNNSAGALAADEDGGLGSGISNGGYAALGGGTVIVRNSTIHGNWGGAEGSGIYNQGTLVVEDTVINDNEGSLGAGIFNAGTLELRRSTIADNFANEGAGLLNEGGSATVESSTIRDNQAVAGDFGVRDRFGGAGILNKFGELHIKDTTITGNSTLVSGTGFAFGGGGIANYALLTVENSTVSGNTVDLWSTSYPGQYGGAGILNVGTLSVANSTIAANAMQRRAGADLGQIGGGGILNAWDGGAHAGELALISTIIAGNSADGSGPDLLSGAMAMIVDADNSLLGNSAGGGFPCGIDGNLCDVDPRLGPLAGNGGTTWTHALLPGSPAIDTGINPLALVWDQRGPGFPRGIGAGVDIGAFERGPEGFPVPEPAAAALLAVGLAGLAFAGYSRPKA